MSHRSRFAASLSESHSGYWAWLLTKCALHAGVQISPQTSEQKFAPRPKRSVRVVAGVVNGADLRSAVERLVRSNRTRRMSLKGSSSQLAQLAERVTVNHKVISSNLILRIWREAPNKREAPCERSSRWLRHDSLISLVAKYSLSTLCIDSECQGSDSPIKQRAQARMWVYGSVVYPPTKPLWPNWIRRNPSKVKTSSSILDWGNCDYFLFNSL